MNTNQNRLQMVEAFMQDTMREENSASTRENCAFDSGYIYLLVALDAPDKGTHSAIEAIQNGTRQLDVGKEKMALALELLNRQCAPEGVGGLLTGLLEWAQNMQRLAGAACTVADLIEILKTHDQETHVVLYDHTAIGPPAVLSLGVGDVQPIALCDEEEFGVMWLKIAEQGAENGLVLGTEFALSSLQGIVIPGAVP